MYFLKSGLQGLKVIVASALLPLLLPISGCSNSNGSSSIDVSPRGCNEPVPLVGADQRELANGYFVTFDESVDVRVRSAELAEQHSDFVVFTAMQESNALFVDSGDATLESIRCEPGVTAIQFNLPSGPPVDPEVSADRCDEPVELSGGDQRELADGYFVIFDESVDVSARSAELSARYSDLVVYSVYQGPNMFSGDSGDETLALIRCEPGVTGIGFNVLSGTTTD